MTFAPGAANTCPRQTTLPGGVTGTSLNLGPQGGLTASNPDYGNEVFSAFTDFGTPAGPGIPAVPGFSGVQGSGQGEQA